MASKATSISGVLLSGLFLWAGFLWITSPNDDQSAVQPANAASASATAASSAVDASSKQEPSAWVSITKGAYMTTPIGKDGLDGTGPALWLTTDSHTGMPMLLILISPSPLCEANGQDISGAINEVFVYYINDKAVPFRGGCVVGKLLLKPTNPKAMEDFMGEFESMFHLVITITAPDGSESQYMRQGFADANEALLHAQIDQHGSNP
jgi:hypothetical protein